MYKGQFVLLLSVAFKITASQQEQPATVVVLANAQSSLFVNSSIVQTNAVDTSTSVNSAPLQKRQELTASALATLVGTSANSVASSVSSRSSTSSKAEVVQDIKDINFLAK